MNTKEIATLKKEFKLDTYKLQIKEIYNVYLKKDNGPIHQELHYFDQMDEEMRELYLKNFKKVISGAVDTKLFELEFDNTEDENNTQKILFNMTSNSDKESLIEDANKIIAKIMESYTYETDVVVTMIKAEYAMNVNKKAMDYDEGSDDIVQALSFVLCSINKIDTQKKALKFDFKYKEFSINSIINDAIINLSAPIGGFMFPALCGEGPDANKVVFYNSKIKELNTAFIEGVLNCSIKMDAETERNTFITILQTAIGDTIKPEVIQDIYERINEVAACCDEELGEAPTISIGEVKTILDDVGVGNSNELQRAFDTYVGENHDFKVQNIIPDFNSKSIKIESNGANITVTPKNLNTIRQVKDKDGRKCLLIELTDDIVIDGFRLETIEEEI